ncbi:MAG: PD40 domain-containing protein [Verrucomicrobia bacterium]|nr:PD40 domain-containing protein [Verrucomicrobiota bacterium]
MNTLTRKLTTVALAGLFAVSTAAAAESLSVLLQKGIYAEETEGNLEAAIKIYEGIVKEGESNRSLVAQAQYRLGVCELKRGKKDQAEAAFRKILGQFADQAEIIAKARERLGELGKRASSIVVRQLASGLEATGDSISANGRILSFVDWDTGNVVVRDLATGQRRRVTDGASWERPLQYADGDVLSDDGKRLAYSWTLVSDANYLYELRIVSLDDSNRRTVLTRTNTTLWPAAWSPTQAEILVVFGTGPRASREYELALVSTENGSVRPLKSVGKRSPVFDIRFSPDGRHIAYSGREEQGAEYDILVLDVSSGVESELVKHPADDRFLGWTPNGNGVLFSSDRRASTDLWLLPVTNGKANGEPVLLKADIGQISAIGVSHDGALYYRQSNLRTSDFLRASLDFETGKLLTPPRQISRRFSALVSPGWSFSPDGHSVVYKQRTRPSEPESLRVLRLDTGHERQIDGLPDFNLFQYPWWLNNETLLIQGKTNQNRLYRVNPTNGEVDIFLTIDRNSAFQWVSTSTDTNTVHYVRRDTSPRRWVLVQHDLKSDKVTETELFREPDPKISYSLGLYMPAHRLQYIRHISTDSSEIDVERERNLLTGHDTEILRSTNRIGVRSPFLDTERLALQLSGPNGERTLKVFDLTRDRPNETLSLALPKYTDLQFSWNTNRWLHFLKQDEAETTPPPPVELWLVSYETGEFKKTELALPRMNKVLVSRDGNQILILQAGESSSELLVMENFLPPVAAAK